MGARTAPELCPIEPGRVARHEGCAHHGVARQGMKPRQLAAALAALAAGDAAHACSACAPLVRARIHDGDFLLNLALVLLPIAVFGLIAWWLERSAMEPKGPVLGPRAKTGVRSTKGLQ